MKELSIEQASEIIMDLNQKIESLEGAMLEFYRRSGEVLELIQRENPQLHERVFNILMGPYEQK